MTATSSDILAVPAHRVAAIERLATELTPGRRVAVSTHMNADGDGCGSEVATVLLLRQMGLEAEIVNPTPWPATFDFLLREGVVDRTAQGSKALKRADVVLVLDISDVKRLGVLAESVRTLSVPKLVIDHHVPSDEPPGPVMLADTSACATGELIFDVARTLQLEITPRIAEALYVAILTDTGSFRFSNTSPRCHAVAGALLTAGVNPEEMYRRVYASAPVGRVRLLAEALGTLEVDAEHGLSWLSLPAGALERYELKSDDLDGIVEHARSIAGTRMALFFRDLGHGKVKVSFRSTGDVDVNRFARQFAGGGHAKASGALVEGSLPEVRDRVIAAARHYLAQATGGR